MLFDKVNTTSETFVSEYLSYHHCKFTAELLALAKMAGPEQFSYTTFLD